MWTEGKVRLCREGDMRGIEGMVEGIVKSESGKDYKRAKRDGREGETGRRVCTEIYLG